MTHRKITLKFWFLGNYWWIFIIPFAAYGCYILFSDSAGRWDLAIPGVTIIITSFFFVQKQRIEELRLFQDLFKDFNQRYDRLNDHMNRIAEGDDDKPLSEDERRKLVDYFNLCGEEYFYYKQRHIYPEVWASWLNGMRYFYANIRIQKIWDSELEQNSYYGFNTALLK